MSTSVFYQALGVRGYVHQSIRFQERGGIIRMRHDGSDLTCPQCGGTNVVRRGTVPRSWSAPPIGARSVTLFADVLRIECRDCRIHPVLPVPFADPRRSYTRSFERLVLCLRKSMTILRHIAIDEISTKKGHVYLTIVLDLESGAVVFVGKGKGAKALNPFWKRLRSSRGRRCRRWRWTCRRRTSRR